MNKPYDYHELQAYAQGLKRYTFRNRETGDEISLLAPSALFAWERFERELIDTLQTYKWYLKSTKPL